MNKYGRAAAVAAAALLVALSVHGVQAKAADWITIFRVQESRVVRVLPRDLEGLDHDHQAPLAAPSGPLAEAFHSLVQVETTQEPSTSPLTAEAMQTKGPAYMPQGFTMSRGSSASASERLVRFDVDGINQMLERLGQQERLPASLKGQVVRISNGAGFTATYDRGDDQIWITQFAAPSVSASGKVDINQVVSALTGLVGDEYHLSGLLRTQLQSLDLSRTLPLPLLEGAGSEVKIGEAKGSYMEQNGQGALMWMVEGQIRTVEGHLSQDELLKIARSWRG